MLLIKVICTIFALVTFVSTAGGYFQNRFGSSKILSSLAIVIAISSTFFTVDSLIKLINLINNGRSVELEKKHDISNEEVQLVGLEDFSIIDIHWFFEKNIFIGIVFFMFSTIVLSLLVSKIFCGFEDTMSQMDSSDFPFPWLFIWLFFMFIMGVIGLMALASFVRTIELSFSFLLSIF